MVNSKFYFKLLSLSLLILFTLSSCKKKKAFKEENAQTTVDVRMFQGQTDEALADINLAIMGQPLMRGRGTEISETTVEAICGLNLDTSLVYKGIIRLEYNGSSCRGIKRTGSVLVTIMDYPLQKWKNVGTILKIDFLAYKCIWDSDSRSIQIDGTEFLQNASGKTWYDLQYLNVQNLVQVLTGADLKATYNANNTADFNVNRRMEYTFDTKSKITSCRIDGLGSYDAYSNVENHGFNRDGLAFYSIVNSPVIWRTSCGAAAPIDGEVIIKLDTKYYDLSCNFSVDKDGNDTDGDNPCPYGWQVKWSYKNQTSSRIFDYY